MGGLHVNDAQLSVRLGSLLYSMRTVREVEVPGAEPVGWLWIPLADADPDDADHYLPIRAHILQVSISAMFQNGRDTHVRQIKIVGPDDASALGVGVVPTDTAEMHEFAGIR